LPDPPDGTGIMSNPNNPGEAWLFVNRESASVVAPLTRLTLNISSMTVSTAENWWNADTTYIAPHSSFGKLCAGNMAAGKSPFPVTKQRLLSMLSPGSTVQERRRRTQAGLCVWTLQQPSTTGCGALGANSSRMLCRVR
jgi:hypothetical protein